MFEPLGFLGLLWVWQEFRAVSSPSLTLAVGPADPPQAWHYQAGIFPFPCVCGWRWDREQLWDDPLGPCCLHT